MELKFTQEVKDKWLENLKSGKYIQGYVGLHNKIDNTFCCIGVLGDCIEGLDNNVSENETKNETNPYVFLRNNSIDVFSIWSLNDKQSKNRRTGYYNDDYSNVIPLIESLQVIE